MFEISSALAAAGTLLGIAKGALEARDEAKVREALSEIQVKLFEATSAALDIAGKASALQGALSEAQDENRVLKAQAAERETYTLAELRTGAYAYARSDPQGGQHHEPPYLCQACYDKGLKAVLRLSPETEYQVAVWRCPNVPSHAISMEHVRRNWTAR